MTRAVLALTLAVATLPACATPATARSHAADLAAVQAQSAEWFVHFSHGDADATANLYAQDAVVMPDKAPALVGRAAIRDAMAHMIAELKSAGITLKSGPDVTGDVSGDMAWVSGTYTMVDASGAVVEKGKYLSVHRRRGGRWEYVRDTWNTDAE